MAGRRREKQAKEALLGMFKNLINEIQTRMYNIKYVLFQLSPTPSAQPYTSCKETFTYSRRVHCNLQNPWYVDVFIGRE